MNSCFFCTSPIPALRSLLPIPEPVRVILAAPDTDDRVGARWLTVGGYARKVLETDLANFDRFGMSIGSGAHTASAMPVLTSQRGA